MAELRRRAAARWRHADVGAGSAIVLVHGLGTDAGAWDRVIPALSAAHRVITVDLPGYSLRSVVSKVPTATELADGLDTLLDGLGVESAVFVGHSFGGAVSLIGAHRHPERCAGLVLIAPGGFGAELNPLLPLIGTRVGARLLRALYGPRTSRAIERLAARVQTRADRASRQESRVRIAELMETYDRLRSADAREQFRTSIVESLALNAESDRTAYADLDRDIPILVLWGREDRVLPPWHADNATALLPWAVVRLMDGAGHTPHRSHPELTAREIAGFADSGGVLRRLSRAGS